MSTLIDWHSHHTAAEVIEEFTKAGAEAPRPDPNDSADFAGRVEEMDRAGIDIQLVSQGAGLSADRFPPEQALAMVRRSNDVIADRISPHLGRLAGTIAITLTDPLGSAAEIDRMAGRGFKAVLMYAQPDKIGLEETEPAFEATSRNGLPIFLHGGGAGVGSRAGMEHLEDGGRGVMVSAHTDAAVADTVVRMIAAGLFDRYPGLRVVIRSAGGGIPMLLNKLYWPHEGPQGNRPYRDILLDHFLVDTASADAITLQFLLNHLGPERVVFGSDYGGGAGALQFTVQALNELSDAEGVRAQTARNSEALLGV
jgi:predicted TIM-barrel fold metal-dependent hydrolase